MWFWCSLCLLLLFVERSLCIFSLSVRIQLWSLIDFLFRTENSKEHKLRPIRPAWHCSNRHKRSPTRLTVLRRLACMRGARAASWWTYRRRAHRRHRSLPPPPPRPRLHRHPLRRHRHRLPFPSQNCALLPAMRPAWSPPTLVKWTITTTTCLSNHPPTPTRSIMRACQRQRLHYRPRSRPRHYRLYRRSA